MNVRELILKLSKLNPDTRVFLAVNTEKGISHANCSVVLHNGNLHSVLLSGEKDGEVVHGDEAR